MISLLCFSIVFATEPIQLKTPTQLSPSLNIAKATPIPFVQGTGKSEIYYLTGKISQNGQIFTEKEEQDTKFQGEIRFTATKDYKGNFVLNLDTLNLISEGVMTEKGNSGLIGLNLGIYDNPVRYDPKTGKMSTEFSSTFHYELIDQTLGFIEPKSEDEDVFLSHTEVMKGKMIGSFPEQMRIEDKESVSLNSELVYTLEKPALGLIKEMRIFLSIKDFIWSLTSPSDVLLIQPVFIGSGPSDPDTTGWVYDSLIRNASMIWGRCGTVRCIIIRTNSPIYIDNDDYFELDNPRVDSTEATALRSEVNIPDAVEVFIVEKWDPLYNGGGATWGSGTASTKNNHL